MSNPQVVRTIIQAAHARGADPLALLATALQETGGNIRWNAVGDAGTSFGPFQYHQGGALGSHTPQWAMSPQEVYDEATRFAQNQIHAGPGAAALQRPADQTGYARGVNNYMTLARQLLSQYGGRGAPIDARKPPGAPSMGVTPTSTPPDVLPGAAPTAPVVPFSMPASSFNMGLRFFQNAASNLAGREGIQAPRIPLKPIPQLPQFAPQAPVARPGTVDVPLNQPGHPNERAAGPLGQRVVGLARHYLGTAYKWGGASPATGFDCSGFAQWLYAQQGIHLPRVAADQFNVGQHVTMKQLLPGDLIFFRDSSGIHHEGIYIGGGRFIHAPHTGDVVKISALSDPYYASQFAGGRRIG